MQDMLTQIITNIALALLGLAASYAIFLINKAKQKVEIEAERIKDEKQRALVKDALNQLNILAAKTVTSIEQTAARSLREAVKDGKVNRQELLVLASQAYTDVYGALKPEYLILLQKELGDINKLITDTIEEKVFEIKEFGACSYE